MQYLSENEEEEGEGEGESLSDEKQLVGSSSVVKL